MTAATANELPKTATIPVEAYDSDYFAKVTICFHLKL